jgi:hypothetical protein
MEQANSLLLPGSFTSESSLGIKGMVATMDINSEAEAASTTQSSATSTTGSEKEDVSGPTSTYGGLVVTGEVDTVDADGVVDAVPGEAKQALREHLRRRLSDGTDVCAHSSCFACIPLIEPIHTSPTEYAAQSWREPSPSTRIASRTWYGFTELVVTWLSC